MDSGRAGRYGLVYDPELDCYTFTWQAEGDSAASMIGLTVNSLALGERVLVMLQLADECGTEGGELVSLLMQAE